MDFNIDDNLTIEGKKFNVSEDLRKVLNNTSLRAVYAGEFLGKKGKKRLIPSLSTLISASKSVEKKVFLNSKGEWLFICGRNLWKQSISKLEGNPQPGDEILIFSEENECLGYGRYKEGKIAIETIFDIGDFLRRERRS